MKYYAVIDTNVLVSALLRYESVPGQIVREATGGVLTPLYNQEILAEYREVLHRPKFPFEENEIEAVLSAIQAYGIEVNTDNPENAEFELPDPDDRVFYEVVMEKRKSEDAFLVTGNTRHFPMKPYVVTPREMWNIILSDE